jgi:hypothetical protein
MPDVTDVGTIVVKAQKYTQIIENPLTAWASYSYTWTLWWLDIDDHNNLMNQRDVNGALAWEPSQNSYVVAEDSGLYPDRRLPTTFGLNYQIQDVKFTTTFTPTALVRGSNLTEGSLTILEPMGCSLIDSLVSASWNGKEFTNWVEHPYMLELNFKGYSDKGNSIPDSLMPLYRKRFPIILKSIKTEVNSSGAIYRCSFAPTGATAHFNEYSKVPKNITVVAGTVQEFFDIGNPKSLTAQINKFWKDQIPSKMSVADAIIFDIDLSIYKSKIVYDKQNNLTTSNTAGVNLDLTKATWTIAAGTPITDVISRVIAQSDFIVQAQLKLNTPDATGNQTTPFNAFKILTKTEYAGIDAAGNKKLNAFDYVRGSYARYITYKIHQYSTWSSPHPAMPLFADSRKNTVKAYNYTFTGQNTDIVELKLNFDLTYYKPTLSWTHTVAETKPTPDTKLNTAVAANQVNITPSLLSRVVTQLASVPNATTTKVRAVINNPNITRGMNTLNTPQGQIGADVINSVYTTDVNMLVAELVIVGDPTLIKQDDWLYVPSPTESNLYNNWTNEGQDTFIEKYGHFRGDVGELPILLQVNSALDMDTELTKQGLAFPDPSNSVNATLFSGQYTLNRVHSIFEKGVFTQKLEMAKAANSAYVDSYVREKANRSPKINLNQTNQLATASTNGVVANSSKQSKIPPSRN